MIFNAFGDTIFESGYCVEGNIGILAITYINVCNMLASAVE